VKEMKGTWWQSPSGHNRVEIRGHMGDTTLLVWNEKDMAEKFMQAELLDDWVQVPPPVPANEVIRTDPKTGGKKGEKLCRVGSLDALTLIELGKVAGYGETKPDPATGKPAYERLNYLKGYDWSLSFNALQRHMLAFWSGEDRDPDSGLPHPVHAAWHALTLTAYYLRGLGTDDRFKQPMPGAQPE
jgi:hypothetical protein